MEQKCTSCGTSEESDFESKKDTLCVACEEVNQEMQDEIDEESA